MPEPGTPPQPGAPVRSPGDPAPPSPADGLLDSLPDATVILDPSRRIAAANRAAGRMLGVPATELAGAAFSDAFQARDHAGRPALDSWPRGAGLRSVRGVPQCPLAVRRPDGSELAVIAAATYRRDRAGNLQGAVVTLRPRPRRPGGEPSAIEVISTVSHELRSPLTTVKGYTSLMLNRWERLSDDQKRMMLDQINHDADRVVRLITELLDISRLETGRLVLRRQLVDVAALAASVVAKVRLEYPELDADLRFEPDIPQVWADPDKIEQVLTNLVENACKYATPEGLQVEGTLGEGGVAVVVTDRGQGIASGDLPEVFTKFFRRAEGRPTGSGLGLWISRGLVEAHGGQLTAASPPGQGASFRFTLPLVDVEKLQQP